MFTSKTHISKTSVYRILKTLVHRGYLAQTQNGQYRLVSRPRRLRFRICGAERGDALFRSRGAERDRRGGGIRRGADHPRQPLRSRRGHAATPRSLSPSAWTWCWSSRWKKRPRRAWPTSSRRPIFRWSPSTCPTPTRPTSAWTTSSAGYEAGALLAQHAHAQMEGQSGPGAGRRIREAGSFVQSRITRRLRRNSRAS